MEKVIKHPETKKATDDKKAEKELAQKLSKAIGMSIEMESNFKLYSYRIIEPGVYLQRVEELVDFYKNAK